MSTSASMSTSTSASTSASTSGTGDMGDGVNTLDEDGFTPLYKAGAGVNTLDGDGFTPLYKACRSGESEVVKALLEAGADVNIECVDCAAYSNDPKARCHHSCVMVAAKRGHHSCVQLLVNKGSDVNKANNGGHTALTLAGYPRMIRALSRAGADVNIAAEYFGSALTLAVEVNHYRCVKALIEAGADVNYWTEHTQFSGSGTAMDLACESGFHRCVDMLIQAGVDVNEMQDDSSFTHLMLACRNNHFKTVDLLLKAGAKVNFTKPKRPRQNWGALMFACEYGLNRTVRALLAAGASVNPPSLPSPVAVNLATQYGRAKTIDILIEAGADVNIVNQYGKTPMEYVYLSVAIIQKLLKGGAKVNVPDHNVLMPFLGLFFSRESKNPKVALILYAAGEKLDKSNAAAKNSGLLFEDLQLNLKHLCREAIRNHLVNLDPHENLFLRIPRLGLPSSMTSYLLYHVTLDSAYLPMEEEAGYFGYSSDSDDCTSSESSDNSETSDSEYCENSA